jgi:exopolysaccharide biosynthesis polyprenyl glycosylphosphotransferase
MSESERKPVIHDGANIWEGEPLGFHMGNSTLRISQFVERNSTRETTPKPMLTSTFDTVRGDIVLGEDVFHSMLTLERRRAERSRQPFVLMLVDATEENGSSGKILFQAIDVLAASTRETDLMGWYQKGAILGIIFTEVTADKKNPVTEILRTKIIASLQEHLGKERAGQVAISLHLFPQDWTEGRADTVADSKLYSDLRRHVPGRRASLAIKRAIDVLGSTGFLLLAAPIFAAIALAIKLTSKGPVFFRQERLGQCGTRFNCLKFRTMYVNCDAKVHQEYVQQFIAGKEDSANTNASKPAFYKITNDPRVTAVGRFLRKTSLDEFPQFWNVLRGEMSLVGPRPPVPYEFEVYDIWHRRRVLELKPGITGLWQVSGRSRTRFDEMVRLDLRYSKSWSLWLDLKILLATPKAVFSGEGAY